MKIAKISKSTINMFFIVCFLIIASCLFIQIRFKNETILELNEKLDFKDQKIEKNLEDFKNMLNMSYEYLNHKENICKNCGDYYNKRISKDIKKLEVHLKEMNTYRKDIFSRISQDVANEIEYELNVYDCTEFAKELSRRLINLGFDSEDVYTQIDCDEWNFSDIKMEEECKKIDGGHRIVEVKNVFIEATTGFVIMPEDYKRYGLE